MEMDVEIGILLGYALGILLLYVVGYLFLVPIKIIGKLLLNSLLGGVGILLINHFGESLGLHIPFNIFTAITAGILGVPGTILLLFLEKFAA